MARTLQHLTLFLASPGDVGDERQIVREVVDEVNRSFARERGVHLEVIGWDTDSFPSYGNDAQAILNDQIANMAEHDLFVGILWNRFGTPTPRAESGSQEEFDRAEESNRTAKSPHIMFYFCQRPTNLRSATDVEQKGKVLQFRGRIQKNGYTFDYTEVGEFRTLFQRHLQLWLTSRTATTPNPPSPAHSGVAATTPQPTSVSPRSATNSTMPVTTVAPPAQPNIMSQSLTEQVNNSGNWVLLGTEFYESDNVVEKNDGTVVLEITPHNAEEEAELRALKTGAQRGGAVTLPFAFQDAAGIAKVIDAERRAASGRNHWMVTVRVEEPQANYFSEAGYNDLSADDIAVLRARLILLNDHGASTGRFGSLGRSNRDLALHLSFIRGAIGGGHEAPEVNPFVELWQRFKGQSALFLPLGRLWAIYHLLITNTVEHVLELTLGPIHDGKIHIRFRGRRHKRYTDADPVTIEFEGDCDLNDSSQRMSRR